MLFLLLGDLPPELEADPEPELELPLLVLELLLVRRRRLRLADARARTGARGRRRSARTRRGSARARPHARWGRGSRAAASESARRKSDRCSSARSEALHLARMRSPSSSELPPHPQVADLDRSVSRHFDGSTRARRGHKNDATTPNPLLGPLSQTLTAGGRSDRGSPPPGAARPPPHASLLPGGFVGEICSMRRSVTFSTRTADASTKLFWFW